MQLDDAMDQGQSQAGQRRLGPGCVKRFTRSFQHLRRHAASGILNRQLVELGPGQVQLRRRGGRQDPLFQREPECAAAREGELRILEQVPNRLRPLRLIQPEHARDDAGLDRDLRG